MSKTALKSGFVAIVGRPNVGKSTLLNKLLGSTLSIVTPKAQTTRERVLGILTEKEGQIVFIDTPGIHRAKEGGINEYMVREAREALESPAAIWYIVDPKTGLEHEKPVVELIAKALHRKKTPVFLIINKSDLISKIKDEGVIQTQQKLNEMLVEAGVHVQAAMRISAVKSIGTAELLAQTWALVPEGPFHYDDPEQLSDRPTRFFVSEKIREQLLLKLGDELPYSCGVEIESFDEKSRPPRIEAIIFVERDSQKGIVVGKGGSKIKEIGQSARKTIEEFLGEHIFLGLKVKVLKDWTSNVETMARMGYKPGYRKSK
jgi:GTP-binding protein Era